MDISIIDTLYFLVHYNVLLLVCIRMNDSRPSSRRSARRQELSTLMTSRGWFLQLYSSRSSPFLFFFQRWTRICKKKVKLLNSGTLRVIGLGSKVKGSNGFLANQQFLICEFFVLFCLDDKNLFKDSSCWIKRRTWFQGEQILIKKYLELLYLELGKKVPWILKIDFEIIFFLSCLF